MANQQQQHKRRERSRSREKCDVNDVRSLATKHAKKKKSKGKSKREKKQASTAHDAPASMDIAPSRPKGFSYKAEAKPPWETYKILFTDRNVEAFTHVYHLSVLRPDDFVLPFTLVSQIAGLVVEDKWEVASVLKECNQLRSNDSISVLDAALSLIGRFDIADGSVSETEGIHENMREGLRTCVIVTTKGLRRLIRILGTGVGDAVLTDLLWHVSDHSYVFIEAFMRTHGLRVLGKVFDGRHTTLQTQGLILRILSQLFSASKKHPKLLDITGDWCTRIVAILQDPSDGGLVMAELDSAVANFLHQILYTSESTRASMDSLSVIRRCTAASIRLLMRPNPLSSTISSIVQTLREAAKFPEMVYLLTTNTATSNLWDIVCDANDWQQRTAVLQICTSMLVHGEGQVTSLFPKYGFVRHVVRLAASSYCWEASSALELLMEIMQRDMHTEDIQMCFDLLMRAAVGQLLKGCAADAKTSALTCLSHISNNPTYNTLLMEELQMNHGAISALCCELRDHQREMDRSAVEHVLKIMHAMWIHESSTASFFERGHMWKRMADGQSLDLINTLQEDALLSPDAKQTCQNLLTPPYLLRHLPPCS